MRWMVLLALWLVACGDGAVDKEDIDSYCDSYCGWKDRCDKLGDKTTTECLASCTEDAQKINYGNYRSSAIQALASCFSKSEECGSDDDCYGEALAAVAPKLQEDERYKRCIEARESCEARPFSDDSCATLLMLTASAQKEFAACYEKSCEKMGDCVDLVTGD